MGRLMTSGWEVGSWPTSGPPNNIEVTSPIGAATFDSGVFRSGSKSGKADSGAGGSDAWFEAQPLGAATALTSGRTYYTRVYMRFAAFPSTSAQVLGFSDTNDFVKVVVTSAGALQLFRSSGDGGGDVQVGSDSSALSLDTWYRIEVSFNCVTGTGNDDSAELLVDGTSVASGSGFNANATLGTPFLIEIGWQNIGGLGANKVMYVDDFAFNDDQGSSQNTWPGEGKVVSLIPISDNQRGSWTGGAGGTTNLYDAINNFPPTGTATETNLTQIESADSSGDNATDEYRGNLTAYSTAGVGASDTVTLLQAFVCHGEDVATGTKTGSFGGESNPSWTYDTFTFGDNVGALGTYPTNWAWSRGAIQYGPSVTVGSSPVVAIRKTDTGTRVASVCSLFMNVEYVPAVAGGDAVMPYAGGGYHPT